MSEEQTMITLSGTRHKVGKTEQRRHHYGRRGWFTLYISACSTAVVVEDYMQPEAAARDCKRCFPEGTR